MKKCINKRCNCDLQDDFVFCPWCGKPQSSKPIERRRTKGTGSIYFRKDKKTNPYAASSSITGRRVYLGCFETKKEAAKALQEYEFNPVSCFNITLEQLHEKWIKTKRALLVSAFKTGAPSGNRTCTNGFGGRYSIH